MVNSGVLVPGGFGHRGTEGMILAAQWAREKKVPFLGICLGFQMAVVEYVRHVLKVSGEGDLLPLPPLCVHSDASITGCSVIHVYTEKLLIRRKNTVLPHIQSSLTARLSSRKVAVSILMIRATHIFFLSNMTLRRHQKHDTDTCASLSL